MKDFHTSINIKGVHIINYFNWEEKLDKLYRKVINPSNLCYELLAIQNESQKQINMVNCQMVLLKDFIIKLTH